MIKLDPAVFSREAIPEQTAQFNKKMVDAINAAPDLWSLPVEFVRQARREGKGVFPVEPFSEHAETIKIETETGEVPLRIIRPQSGAEKGVFLHIHGGGGMYGAADMQDQRLQEIADGTGLACASVEYRLTPENPYPAGFDDCEAAAVWLANGAAGKLDTSFLAIGGESAGAQLAASTLARLRDNHKSNAFSAAVLIAGIYDMSLTPSAANFHEKLILTTRDITKFSEAMLQGGEDRKDPDISPLYNSLEGMPAAHFSIGTKDALLDDTLFMASRWSQYQPDTELDIFPGGCHVFQYFDELDQARTSRMNINAFLKRQMSLA